MEKFELAGFAVEIDRLATKRWYAKAEEWGCECGDCRHFLKLALARDGRLPAPVTELLMKLSIPAEKATYVCQITPEGDGDLFQFSYRIAGRILSEGDEKTRADWVRCCHEPYPYGAPDFPEPHFDLEFWVVLPREA